MTTLKEIYDWAHFELSIVYEQVEREALLIRLLEDVFQIYPHERHLRWDGILLPEQLVSFQSIIGRLKQSEPYQYILGEVDFYGLKLKVNPSVLIPRQETEELVSWILQSHRDETGVLLDLGTGSGAIAIALKNHCPRWEVNGMDISEEAVKVAIENAKLNGLSVNFFQDDLLQPKALFEHFEFDLMVSNPPYVRWSERKYMHSNVLDYEPELALFVEDLNPLIYYRAIVEIANNQLKEGGWLYFEINESLGVEMIELFINSNYRQVEIKNDLNGKRRMIRGRKQKLN